MSTVIGSSIQIWRQKAADGTITLEEMRQAIAAIRAERVGASTKSDTSRASKATAKAKAAPVDSDALLDELF
jgi:hypothetical protein